MPIRQRRSFVRAARHSIVLAEFAPAFLLNVHAMILGGLLDAFECFIALLVRDALNLVKARKRIADVARIFERFLALFWERKLVLVELVALLLTEFAHERLLAPSSTSQRRKRSKHRGRRALHKPGNEHSNRRRSPTISVQEMRSLQWEFTCRASPARPRQ